MRVKAVAGFVGVMGVVFVAAAMLAQGCGGGSAASCAVGKESCPCTPGGACDPGLTCASMKCVNLGTVDGGGTAGATGTAGGTAGGGGAGASGGTAEAACANYGAVCQKINDCAPLVVKVGYGTVDKCIARSKLSCMDAFKAPDSGDHRNLCRGDPRRHMRGRDLADADGLRHQGWPDERESLRNRRAVYVGTLHEQRCHVRCLRGLRRRGLRLRRRRGLHARARLRR